MNIGIGIDTGGTCTDAVIYHFADKKILAYAKTLTTKEDLSVGIGNALDALPAELVAQAEVIALSTTLATNACVENKGGRARLALFGIEPSTIAKVGRDYGLPLDDTLCYIDSKTKPSGEIVEPPDWAQFTEQLHARFDHCDAVGVVEMFAKKTGAVLEKKAEKLLRRELDIPIVCGHTLFSEYNIAKRGASALLNARLIPVIQEFLSAVKKALRERQITAPFVIVRSDGSLMTESFTATRPVETLLSGPVASVMGAVELSSAENCVIVDIGGTTTDIAFVKNGQPQRVSQGVKIGSWDTFVKGLFVDTFGLGGDSGVRVENGRVSLEAERVLPLCVAAQRYPRLLSYLEREANSDNRVNSFQQDIYLAVRDISDSGGYTAQERRIAAALSEPLSMARLGKSLQDFVIPSHIQRLVREGVLIRCGVTPTDAMHVKGDFNQYRTPAAHYGLSSLGRLLNVDAQAAAELIYDAVKEKLYCNIVRILIEDAFPRIRQEGLTPQLSLLIADSYQQAQSGAPQAFLGLSIQTPAALIGVGAPTHVFLPDVGRCLGAKVYTSEYAKVANALGAIVGQVCASVTMEVSYNASLNTYTVFGAGTRCEEEALSEAKARADSLAAELAAAEASRRGADDKVTVTLERQESVVDTDFGAVYLGYQVTATASGHLKLS